MNARFSSSQFEQPQDPAELQIPEHEAAFAGLIPSEGRDSRTAFSAPETSHVPDPVHESAAESVCEEAAVFDEIYIPDHYEANYAYPLLVWLQTTTWPRAGFERIMRMVSERNYFGVALPVVDADRVEEQLQATFARLRRRYRLHTERVFLLGIGEAGTQALATGLSQPDWFGGVAAISSHWPTTSRPLARYDELRGKRVLLGVDDRDDESVVTDVERAQKLLWTAGMHVTTLSCTNGGKTCPGLFRELDRWVMQSVEQPELVC
jgi:phospholipase/carboxylesterase